jgi:glyoxylase-like metal-dependent hydrolase (beta-lactamase superfamily II)
MLQRLTPRVYYLPADPRADRPILGAVVGAHALAMVDAGNSPAHVRLFHQGLGAAGLPSPAYVALTHWHWDHTFGAQALDAPLVAHAETRRVLSEMAGWDWSDAALEQRVADGRQTAFGREMLSAEWPDRSNLAIRLPDITFMGEMTLHLGGVDCRLLHVGGDHSPDSTVVHVPQEGVAFLGDCTAPDLHHGPWRYTLAEVLPLMERLAGLGADWYVFAHDDHPWSRAEAAAHAADLRAIGEYVERQRPCREELLEMLPQLLGRLPGAGDIEEAEAFLAGLSPWPPAGA